MTTRFSTPCRRAEQKLSAYVDGALPHAERREVAVHLRECSNCAYRYDRLAQVRMLMKRLPQAQPPADLTANLHAMAQRESLRKQVRIARRLPWALAFDGRRVRLENLMRPLALPFAGGLVSALVLFSMLIPTYPVAAHVALTRDVPTAFYTDPSVSSVPPFGFCENEVVVEVVIDEQGRVVDLTFPDGIGTDHLRREIENSLLFARFTPAMAFGYPTSGRVRLSFRRSQIDVKG
ncbi:MAG: zf-HC2 domain-containing protein [Acidobacteria bacterium]|nr:zf-HC2 domain-containing protein [Acidobacteriota bacterium]